MIRHFVELDRNGVVFHQWTWHDAPADAPCPKGQIEVTTHPERTDATCFLFCERQGEALVRTPKTDETRARMGLTP